MTVDQDLLLVYSDPGDVPLDEFNDWYDNEHVPLRMQFPEFHNGFRFTSADHVRPRWMATYEVEAGFLETDRYGWLRSHRSEREQDVVHRLPTLDRRIYDQIRDYGELHGLPRYQVVVGMTSTDEAGLLDWYDEEHVPLLLQIPGWHRVRQFRLREGSGEALLAIHDIDDPALFNTTQWKVATSTPRRTSAMSSVTQRSRRVFRFHNSGRRLTG